MRLIKALALATCLCTPTIAIAQPNVLLIIADDMGLDASKCYNVANQQASMPNLEKMCEEGMVFENFYAAPTCSPTRATIMTGKYGFRTGVGAPVPRNNEAVGWLKPDEISIFDVVTEANYASNLIGKWHLAPSPDAYTHPQELGISEFYGAMNGGVRDFFKWNGVAENAPITVDEYNTTNLTNKAINWIGDQDEPWFLWLAYNAAHTPFHLPPEELLSNNDLSGDEADIKENPVAYYNAMLEAMDSEIGRLINSIPTDERDETTIIFIGDNGTPGQVANRLYGENGAKGSLFEGGTNVPMIAVGPNVAKGRNIDLANTTDLFATIATLTGGKANAPDSIDMLDMLGGGRGARQHAYVEYFSEHETRGNNIQGWAIRDAQYKLVAQNDMDKLLFDMQADPMETNNLLASGNEEAKQKAAELQAAYEALKN